MVNDAKLPAALAALRFVAFGRLIVRFRIVVVPVVAPSVTEVPAPPIFKTLALVLKRFAVAWVVVRLPPFTATLPSVVISPVAPVKEKWVAVMLPAPRLSALTMCASDRSIPLVIVPPPVEVTAIPAGKVLEALPLSTLMS